ncbi:MAG: hypothetical protein AABM67_18610 [Acidobacteriota bacterium]
MNTASNKTRFALHGYAGIAIVIAAEALLFGGNELVGHWFTPIIWTGYILFIDALVYKLKGRSLLMNDRLEFLVVAVISIACWWLFELYNAPRFWNSNLELWWHYHNLEPNLYWRRAGYDWAFATIFPAMFETAELFTLVLFKPRPARRSIKFPKPVQLLLVLAGVIGVIAPLVFLSEWWAPIVWLSFILLLDPINAWRGSPSITGDLSRGDWRRLGSLLAGGLICGFLWEFWNYWALTKWTYTVPFFGNIKIFEMPVLGYLGFPPFAVECWVMYIFLRTLLKPAPGEVAGEIFLKS